jgi:sporulation protein YlmC with PRC-barrel domain
MLHKAIDDLRGDFIIAKDGRIGSLADVYFDDESWRVRYLVVDTGDWLPGRKVLISPAAVAREGRSEDVIPVQLTRKQVEHSPGIDADKPVSRQFEEAHARYYGYPYYWEGAGMWGAMPTGMAAPPPAQHAGAGEAAAKLKQAERAASESHLRSAREVAGYAIEAADGAIGHVEDLALDEADWSVADLVVDTRDWLPGDKVFVPSSSVSGIDWEKRAVRVTLTRDEIKRLKES